MSEILLTELHNLFDFKSGISSNKVERVGSRLSENHIHFVRPSHKQISSIDAFVDRILIPKKYIFPEGSIYVATNGQGSHTYSYVSTEEFVPNSDVYVLIPKGKMSIEEKLFYAFCITKNRYKFNYNRKPKGSRLKNLLVPKEAPREWLSKVDFEKLEKVTQAVNSSPTPDITVPEWEYYELGELFHVKYGINLELVNLEEATGLDKDTIRFVSRTANNNGVSALVKKLPAYIPNPANTISVAGGGSVLATFLQTDEYYSGRDIYYLQPKEALDNAALLFVATLIRREKYRFNYGRQANKSLKSLKIKLPTKNNCPDWNFISSYIQTLPFSSQI